MPDSGGNMEKIFLPDIALVAQNGFLSFLNANLLWNLHFQQKVGGGTFIFL